MAKPINLIQVGSTSKIVFDDGYTEFLTPVFQLRVVEGYLICIKNISESEEYQIPFDDIIDKHGTSNASDLTDYWAENNFFNSGGSSPLPTDNLRGGVVDYNDLATQSTPLVLVSDTIKIITNDMLGPSTNRALLPEGVTDIWDSSNNQFDWADLKIGDWITIRIDLEITTSSPNTQVHTDMILSVGDLNYAININTSFFKSSGVHSIFGYTMLYMGDLTTLNNPARLEIVADGASTLIVNGWACAVFVRG